jgi:hypothetical protein
VCSLYDSDFLVPFPALALTYISVRRNNYLPRRWISSAFSAVLCY